MVPAVEVKILPAPGETTVPQFTYKITGVSPNNMNIKLYFANPAEVSSGVAANRISVTFWSSSLLVGKNGVPLKEGLSIAKTVQPQMDPLDQEDVTFQGKLVGWLIAGIIVFCLLFAPFLDIDSLPFWQFFFLWQLFTHMNLLNIKTPAFASTYWQQMLNIWILRLPGVREVMNGLITEAKPYKHYSPILAAGGFDSLHVIVNLGLILWIPCLIIVLMPFAWYLDTFCSMPDERLRMYGGRKPMTKRPLLEILTNMLTRYALMSVLDVMICVFISIDASRKGIFSHADHLTNLIVSWILVGLVALFVLMILISAIWRKVEMNKSQTPFEVPVNRWFKNLYDGFWPNHPERHASVMLSFIARQFVYAAVVVFLNDSPVFQLFALMISSLMYNLVVAKMKPYYSYYNMGLHYFNESCFCIFVILCMAFTNFVPNTDVRTTLANGLINFLLAIFFVNFAVCVGVIIKSQRHHCRYTTKVKPVESVE